LRKLTIKAADDGSQMAQYDLACLPAWDGMAAAYGKLFIVNQDGSIECWGAGSDELDFRVGVHALACSRAR
jgi:hypothetical protein